MLITGHETRTRELVPEPLIMVCTFGLLCVALPLALIVSTPGAIESNWLGGLAVALSAGLRYSYIVGRGQQRLSEMSFWLFSYVFLGLAPMVQQRTGMDPGTTPGISHSLDAETYGVVLVGLFATVVGIAFGRHKAKCPRRASSLVGSWPRSSNETRLIVLAIAGSVMTTYFIANVGVAELLGSRDGLSRAANVAWPDVTVRALIQASSGMSLLVAFIGLIRLRATAKADLRLFSRVMLVVVTVLLLLVVNPISSARYSYGTVLLAMAAALGAFSSLRKFRISATCAVLALLLIFPLADAFRRSAVVDLKFAGPVSSLQTGDFDSFDQINNAVRFVETEGSLNGGQALGVVLFWVPRSVWPDKPTDTGVLLAQSRGYAFTNLSAPLWAEWFINGGWALLILGMMLVGFIVGRSDEKILGLLKLGNAPGILGCILPFYLIILLRGSLLQACSTLAVILVCAAFVRTQPTAGVPNEQDASSELAGE